MSPTDPNTARALVRGLVDAINYPAFVTSPTLGIVACNESAKALKRDWLNNSWTDGDVVEISEKEFRVISTKLNHKTDCVLFELHDITGPQERLKFAGALLDKALSGAF